MIKCEGEVVTIKGSWKQIMSEYMKLSEAIIIYSDKKYRVKLTKDNWRKYIDKGDMLEAAERAVFVR